MQLHYIVMQVKACWWPIYEGTKLYCFFFFTIGLVYLLVHAITCVTKNTDEKRQTPRAQTYNWFIENNQIAMNQYQLTQLSVLLLV